MTFSEEARICPAVFTLRGNNSLSITYHSSYKSLIERLSDKPMSGEETMFPRCGIPKVTSKRTDTNLLNISVLFL
jgi:hypothetical protein